MKTKTLALITLAALSACGANITEKRTGQVAALTSTECTTRTVNVLIIGDSISLGYTHIVAKDLPKIHIVHSSIDGSAGEDATNARNSSWTLAHIDEYLALCPKWDVITWNNGLWDISSKTFTPIAEYADNLIRIASKLQATGARVAFFNTTPIFTGSSYCDPALVAPYNAAAFAALANSDVELVDMNAYAQLSAEYQDQGGIHFNQFGYIFLSKYVTFTIERLLI